MKPNMEFRPGLEAKPKGIAPGTQGYAAGCDEEGTKICGK